MASASSTGPTATETASATAMTTAGPTTMGSASESSSGGNKFDVGGMGDLGPGTCSGEGGELEFSYIWIANSTDGTVSKIDTWTGTEVGRYASGPGMAQDREPSRTSVNLYGDAVVVNRGSFNGMPGSVTKIVARLDDCVDANDDGEITTSSGPVALPWGEDECVAWNVPVESVGYEEGPRPVAWEGTQSEDGCLDPNARLWFGFHDFANNRAIYRRLDGATGDLLDEVIVESWSDLGLAIGPYGGAVDKDGDFWVTGFQDGPLIQIDAETLEVDYWSVPDQPDDYKWVYGMALDQYGNPWIASGAFAHTFNAETQQWDMINTGNLNMRGVMVDREDRAWFAVDAGPDPQQECGVAVIDVSTHEIINSLVTIPGCSVPVGVSIDPEGYVWVVDHAMSKAFKLDPDTYAVELEVTGLISPYTYSDMTGGGLGLVVNPPG